MPQGQKQFQIVGLACVVATALGWGLNWPATKLLLTECPPLSARGVAGLVAAVLLFGIALFRGESIRVPRVFWAQLAATAFLNVTAWMGFTTASLLWLPAGQAVIIAYTMPIWAVLLAWPLLGDRPAPWQIGAIISGICGLITLVGLETIELTSSRVPGIVLALSAAVLFALGAVVSKRSQLPLPRVSLTAWQVGIGCIPLLIGGLVFEHARFATLPAIGWFALGYTALISMGLCYLLWFAALRRLTASTAAIGTLLTPVVGVIASSIALGDQVTISQAVALALVLAGIVLAARN